ncbi:hypothetical protein BGX27_009285 [Mortierella sp. AM989]|nr:hypothetical protein BGX27_009285 [Mortierella sp. AM989]
MENNEIKSSDQESHSNVPVAKPYSQILDRSLWTRKEYMVFTTGLLLQAFSYSFESNLFYGVLGYVISYYQVASLGSVFPTILEILRAALVPFYIKFSDVSGRFEAIACAMFFYLLGFTIQGTSQSFVQLAVGQVFYGIGSTGVYTLTQVLVADTTYLIDRGIMFAIWDMPTLVSIFLAQVLTDPLTLPTPGGRLDKWRNAYALMGVLSLAGAVVLLAPLWYLQRKATRVKTRRFERRSVRWLMREFDVVGALLLTASMSLTLLPLILAKSVEGNWKSPMILGTIIAGVIFFFLLIIWEAKYTTRPIMSTEIWKDRTTFGGLIVTLVFAIMNSVNYQYFTLYLVISRELTFGDALLLERGYPIAWLIFQLITAFLMKRYNACRLFVWSNLSLFLIGIFINLIGVGLMIPARLPTSSDAFVVISQAIAGSGAGIANVASNVAITAMVEKKDVASVIGAAQILASMGYAFGGALAGGVWTQYLPSLLDKYITGPYDESLAMNDPLEYIPSLDPTTKSQLIEAYADSQKLMSIITCCFTIIACICTWMMEPVDLLKDQVDKKGEVTDIPESSEKEEVVEAQ